MAIEQNKQISNGTYFRTATATFLVVFIFIYVYLFLNGRVTVAEFSVLKILTTLPAISTFVAITALRYSQKQSYPTLKPLHKAIFLVATSLSTAIISGVSGYTFSLLIFSAFKNITYTAFGLSLLTAGLSSFLVYVLSNNFRDLSQKKFSLLILVTFLSGFFFSAVNNHDYIWWQHSICSLGMPINKTGVYYNLTLLLTGVMILMLGYYLKPQVNTLVKNRIIDQRIARLLTALYCIQALSVSAVGALPYGVSEPLNAIHVFLGYFAFLHFGMIVLFSYFLFPKLPKKFILLSYLELTAFAIYYFINLRFHISPESVVEIVAIFAAAIWFSLFTRTLASLAASIVAES